MIDASYNGSVVETRTGAVIELTLDGNPTTGFEWTVKNSGVPVLKQLGEPGYKAESDLLGAGGVYTWRFEVVKAGSATFELDYSRPSEQQTPPTGSFRISVEASG